jgi:hypothetical protein
MQVKCRGLADGPIGNLQHHPERGDEGQRRRDGGKDQKASHGSHLGCYDGARLAVSNSST